MVNPESSQSGAPIAYSTHDPAGEPVGHGLRYLAAVSPDGDLYAGIRELGEPGGFSCLDTLDLSGAQTSLLHSCKSSPFAFSPDSVHTAEYAPQRDGEPAWIDIRDARTGELAAKIVAKGDSDTSNIEPVVWEDADHYLVTALHQGRWLLLRGDLEGHLEIADGPTAGPNPGQPYESPYVIAR